MPRLPKSCVIQVITVDGRYRLRSPEKIIDEILVCIAVYGALSVDEGRQKEHSDTTQHLALSAVVFTLTRSVVNRYSQI
jgi:hypothetical protein